MQGAVMNCPNCKYPQPPEERIVDELTGYSWNFTEWNGIKKYLELKKHDQPWRVVLRWFFKD